MTHDDRWLTRARFAAITAPLALVLSTTSLAGQAVTPTPTVASTGACPVDRTYAYDVGSVANAQGVRWELLSSTSGSPDVTSAQSIVQANSVGTTGQIAVDPRDHGPVLNGTTYYFRVRAMSSSSQPAAEWSNPIIHADPSATPDGMFQASASSASPPLLQLDWALNGALGACSDRVAYRIWQGEPSGPPAYSGTFAGTSGSQGVDVGGSGSYAVRLAARYGGDTQEDNVGRGSSAVSIALGPTLHDLAVSVTDDEAGTCAGTTYPRAGATVRVARGGQVIEERTVDANGRTTFRVPPGEYELIASSSPCQTVTRTVAVQSSRAEELAMAGCHAEGADLSVAFESGGSLPTRPPYTLTATVRNLGPGLPSMPAQLVIERRDENGQTTRLASESLTRVCASEGLTATDDGIVGGRSFTYVAWIDALDASRDNNRVEKSVLFPVEATPRDVALPPARSTPVFPPPGVAPPVARPPTTVPTKGSTTPVAPSIVPVTLESFQLQDGAATANLGQPVTLNASWSGNPAEYRAALCDAFAQAPFQSLVGRLPAMTFSTTGIKSVCLQLRSGTQVTEMRSDDIDIRPAPVEVVVLNPVAAIPVSPDPVPTNYSEYEDLPLIGGGGNGGPGENRSFACSGNGDTPPYAVGVIYRAGQYVDALGIRCAGLANDGTHQLPYTTEGVFGGTGGTERTLTCSSGQVLVGLRIRYGEVVDRLAIGCAEWRSHLGTIGNVEWSTYVGGSGGPREAEVVCPQPLMSWRLAVFRKSLFFTGPYVGLVSLDCVPGPGL